MSNEELAKKIKSVIAGKRCSTRLSQYSFLSIMTGCRSYPLNSLLTFCEDMELQMAVTDMLLDESYDVDSEEDIINIISMMGSRYKLVDSKVCGVLDPSGKRSRNPKKRIYIKAILEDLSEICGRLDFIRK